MVKVGTVLSIMFVEHEYCFQKQIVRKNSQYVKFQRPPPPLIRVFIKSPLIWVCALNIVLLVSIFSSINMLFLVLA